LKRLIPFAIAALSFSGCLKEKAWCPTIEVSFEMKDEFLTGDYDSRVRNDVLLYIYNGDKLVYSDTVPYERISGGKYFAIPKTEALLGDIRFVAWAVASGETETGTDTPLAVHHTHQHPAYAPGSDYSAIHLAHLPDPLNKGRYVPHHHERYMGTLNPHGEETWERNSRHDIVMTPAPGRVVVNIHDPHDMLARREEQQLPVGEPHVVIEGGMSHMNLGAGDDRTSHMGYGDPAPVRTILRETTGDDDPVFSTGLTGVLPSRGATPLVVHVMLGDEEVGTLVLDGDHTDGRYTALHSGDLIEFDYDLPEAMTGGEFEVTINGYEIRVVNVPGGGL